MSSEQLKTLLIALIVNIGFYTTATAAEYVTGLSEIQQQELYQILSNDLAPETGSKTNLAGVMRFAAGLRSA